MPRRLPRILVPFAVAAIVAAASSAAWATSQRTASATAVQGTTVYLAPASKGGSDKRTGLSWSSPILTPARAQEVLEQQKPTGDVQIQIDQGTYVAGQTRWTFYVPGHTISLMSVNYVLGPGRPPGGDPVFADTGSGGAHTAGWWLQTQEPSSGPLRDGGTTGLRFYYLQIEDYTTGISLYGQAGHSSQSRGMYIRPSNGVNGNSISGMTFTHTGDLYAPGQTGFGAILLTDSSGNDITNNTFDHIENALSPWVSCRQSWNAPS